MEEEVKELRQEETIAEIYLDVSERIKAVILDSVLIVVFMILLTNIL